MSPVFDCTTEEGRAEGLEKAAAAVRAGEVVVIPTDTVYGIGADAFSTAGVQAVLEAKGRGREMPPPVLVPNVRTVDGLATEVAPYVRDLIKTFWPGALTVILKAQPSLHWDLGDTNGTVALRMPDEDLTLTLLAEVGPMAVTSANRTGQPAATTILDAATQLGSAVTVYLDAGPSPGGQASTIVDCTGESPVVLREGGISQAQLSDVLERHFPPEAAAVDEPAVDEPAAEEPAAEEPPDHERPGEAPADAPAPQDSPADALELPGHPDSRGEQPA